MKYWLESLVENGFDVFIVVYMAMLLIIYHYLLRWYINIKYTKIYNKLKSIEDYLHELLWDHNKHNNG
jgi:hypothetical protein